MHHFLTEDDELGDDEADEGFHSFLCIKLTHIFKICSRKSLSKIYIFCLDSSDINLASY